MANPNLNRKDSALGGLETEVAVHLATAGSQPQPGQVASTANELLTRVLLQELEEKQAKRQQEQELAERLHKRNLEMVTEQIAKKNAEQANCSHLKENGRACVSGQRLQNGNYIFLCLRCQKEFDQTNLPQHLASSLVPGSIGGA